MEWSDRHGVRMRSTDFSIDRLLSVEPNINQASEPLDWLCCTRYRPPRVPRISTNSHRVRRAGRHARVPFTAAQAAALEAAYARAPYLAPPALRALASALQLRDDRIKIWFQNRRARERREKCASISPPRSVTLPPSLAPILPAHVEQFNDPFEAYRESLTHNMNLRNTPPIQSSTPVTHLQLLNVGAIETGSEEESCSRDVSGKDRPESPLDVDTIEN